MIKCPQCECSPICNGERTEDNCLYLFPLEQAEEEQIPEAIKDKIGFLKLKEVLEEMESDGEVETISDPETGETLYHLSETAYRREKYDKDGHKKE